MDETHRHVELALHSAGVGAREAVRAVGQVEVAEQLVRALGQASATQAMQPALEVEVFAAGGLGIDGNSLADDADEPPNLLRMLDHVDATDEGGAAVRADERRQQLDRRRLAGAVGTEQAEDRCRAGAEADAIESRHRPRIGLDQIDRRDDCLVVTLCWKHRPSC